MKKIFSLIVGLVTFATLQAASYSAAALITMSCAGGPEAQDLMLFVDPAQVTPVTSPNLAALDEVGQVKVYVSYESGQFSSYKANLIKNLPLGMVTNRRDVSYTFTFNVPVDNVVLTLTDLRSATGVKTIDIADGESYTFSVADEANYAANTNVEIADRFIINYFPKYDVTLNANGLATFSATDAVSIPDGLTAYTATGLNGDVLGLAEITADQVPANTGVILYGAANADYELPIIASAAAISGDNYLYAATVWPAVSSNTVYILHGNELWEYTGSDMKANKAYLQLPAGAPKRIRLAFDQATAIDAVEAEVVKAEKFVENGQIFIRRGNEVFNLQGQLVK